VNPFPAIWKLMAAGALIILLAGALDALDRAYPPPLDARNEVAVELVDRDGALLRAFATEEGRWRLAVKREDVDPHFIKMLIAYEDQRFERHFGVDPLALIRAAGQLVVQGRIVSGGSTLTMQLARLLEPGRPRTVWTKIIQIARAIQIERRLDKEAILARYLTLAPYGGNLEGVRAASIAYFGREPRRLTTAQAALLVALPQSPESRRPDRFAAAARIARGRVLARVAQAGAIEPGEVARAMRHGVPTRRRAMPALAAHLAERKRARDPALSRHRVTLVRTVQSGLETVARDGARRLGEKVSVAMVLADSHTGDILGEVGSANFFDSQRAGWIDMTNVPRSPGSTLKPLIYGVALEQGLAMPETIIEDRPASFAGNYRPRNFDMAYQGDVSIRQALQMSLNVPAVRLLEAIGPTRLMARLKRSGAQPRLPEGEQASLAIGLGGLGISLKDLVQLYTAFPGLGRAVALADDPRRERVRRRAILQPAPAWHVGDILAGVAPPTRAGARRIAYKTGTSYGYRDAWSVGFDGRYVLGVWVGRADGASVPGLTGRRAAAPLLFEAFAKSGLEPVPFAAAPAGAVRMAYSELPVTLRRFSSPSSGLISAFAGDSDPRIVYPPQDARIALGLEKDAQAMPLVIKLQGGRAPFRWLANGRAMPDIVRRRSVVWTPDGQGYSTLTVIDANGRADSVRVYLE